MNARNRDDIKKLGTILSVWAHPDDETLSCAGIMAKALSNGQKVICITATRGEAGVQDEQRWPAKQLGTIRAQELKNALSIIGVQNHHWLNYPDGECQYQDEKSASSEILEYIDMYKPDTILTFGPDGLTGHPDHKAISEWVTIAVRGTTKKIKVFHAVIAQEQFDTYLSRADEKLNIFFNISEPPLVSLSECDLMFCCDEKIMCTIKREAIAAMPSQTAIMHESFNQDFIDNAFMYEAFMEAK